MSRATLLIEIGCEEIPARMIPAAATELGRRILRILEQAGLACGPSTVWGGSRRLAVRVEAVPARQVDRDERLLGPAAKVAFDEEGRPTRAAEGFARKLGVAPGDLQRIETERGPYVGVERRVAGLALGAILAEHLPAAVAGMSFPKTMRWSEGVHRWVRPVHWLVALHGAEVMPITLFGVAGGNRSVGHRFLAGGEPVAIPDAEAYLDALHGAHVIADPARRRELLSDALESAAGRLGGKPVADPALLEEVVDLVEWPGVVGGAFDPGFLDLPRELLVTTLRHHQKCFSVQDDDGRILPGFLAVTNTAEDPAGHIRRGNEWVVGGRLEDARFFWSEDSGRRLDSRLPELDGVLFHAKCGSFLAKATRSEELARRLASALGLEPARVELARVAARLAKADLVTSLVGEFPELQGVIGGLLLAHDGAEAELWQSVYDHYRPAGPAEAIPRGAVGRVVAAADKLDTLAELLRAGERPTGSRDPLGLRRAGNGLLRIAIESGWPLTLAGLRETVDGDDALAVFLRERLVGYLRESGYSTNEIHAVTRPRAGSEVADRLSLGDVTARLEAIKAVRGREDFVQLVQLTERVDTFLAKNGETLAGMASASTGDGFCEQHAAVLALAAVAEELGPRIEEQSRGKRYSEVVDALAGFVRPVDRFFEEVLVLDSKNPAASGQRGALLGRLREILINYFDIRELAGQADRRAS